MYAQINGQNIYYETTGSGRPLLMVHGNSEDHTIFTEAAEVLKDHFTVYLIDSRGHGLSGKVDEIHYEQLSDDMAEFLEQLDLKDVVYYGFSDGGIIGLLLASRTKRVSQMILSGTNITPNGVKTWLKVLVKVLYFFTRDPRMKMVLEEPHISLEELQAIDIKTTVVAGEKDAVTYEETKAIADNIPNAKLIIIPKAGHGSYIVHKTEIADLILEETK